MGKLYEHLSAEERGVIMSMKVSQASGRAIAQVLRRSPSTIARELRRNDYMGPSAQGALGRPRIAGGYDAARAGKRARRLRRTARTRPKLQQRPDLWAYVQSRLHLRFSPEQIARTLKDRYPHEPSRRVSHETIYTAIYAMPRGQLRRTLVGLLRQG